MMILIPSRKVSSQHSPSDRLHLRTTTLQYTFDLIPRIAKCSSVSVMISQVSPSFSAIAIVLKAPRIDVVKLKADNKGYPHSPTSTLI
ncbi:hypothetical protein BLNAU_4107 [Blattamonas nauphoetae]|uniref:Uncharacterized protein n=1 Tax=Blattamonas nauphoetae TaxID=2049346 RepID=A0ABQ9Y0W4_9EUKA|nr:hypothetical protein BLNAU_7731 [Blattamonas nauphoetae]KAK2961020.1 hypothetical protein BLNAU_4107 [Blattamonas nauphoetae]